MSSEVRSTNEEIVGHHVAIATDALTNELLFQAYPVAPSPHTMRPRKPKRRIGTNSASHFPEETQ